MAEAEVVISSSSAAAAPSSSVVPEVTSSTIVPAAAASPSSSVEPEVTSSTIVPAAAASATAPSSSSVVPGTSTTVPEKVHNHNRCSSRRCRQPGTKVCGACKTTPYCGEVCQTLMWPRHKEECQGHLLKVGIAYTKKAQAFYHEHNFMQTIRFAELALTKLMRLKDRPPPVIQILDEALNYKFNALNMNIMSRLKDRGA